jgi:hypothetical protein
MLELVGNARMIWTGILEVASLLPTEPSQQTWLAAGTGIVRDTPRLTASLRGLPATRRAVGACTTKLPSSPGTLMMCSVNGPR